MGYWTDRLMSIAFVVFMLGLGLPLAAMLWKLILMGCA